MASQGAAVYCIPPEVRYTDHQITLRQAFAILVHVCRATVSSEGFSGTGVEKELFCRRSAMGKEGFFWAMQKTLQQYVHERTSDGWTLEASKRQESGDELVNDNWDTPVVLKAFLLIMQGGVEAFACGLNVSIFATSFFSIQSCDKDLLGARTDWPNQLTNAAANPLRTQKEGSG